MRAVVIVMQIVLPLVRVLLRRTLCADVRDPAHQFAGANMTALISFVAKQK